MSVELASTVLAAQPFRPELLQQQGFVHSGVLSYAADNALTFAAGSVLGTDIMTAGFTITYLSPAQGVLLRAKARTDGATRTQALCRPGMCTNKLPLEHICTHIWGRRRAFGNSDVGNGPK